MEKLLPIARQLSRARWLPPLVVLLTLAMLGATIYLDTARLRAEIRRQTIEHDGEVLFEVARMEQIDAESPAELVRQIENPAGQLALALKLSKLREGVLGVRLFDGQGKSILALPVSVSPAELTPLELAGLRQLRPVSRYVARARLDEFFLVSPMASASASEGVPLHLVLIPIHLPGQPNLLASAQLILDGQGMAREFAQMDRKLFQRAVTGFVLTGGILVTALVWVFRRLQKINRRLQDQAASLRRANQELALASKTDALGAVTAHLMHGLTSPLAGLHQFIAARADADTESKDALRSAERMQALIDEAVRLLSEENGGVGYELDLDEMMEVLASKILPLAQFAGVRYEARLQTESILENRDANLILLILENLLRNSIQATPRGGCVRLTVRPIRGQFVCEVADEGPGLPEAVRRNLFAPCHSTKPDGHGIGLAISQQLARRLGAELKLVHSSTQGCAFALSWPADQLRKGETPEPAAQLVTSN